MNKKPSKATIKGETPVVSIKYPEVRADLNDYVQGKHVVPGIEKPNEKPSLPDHLYNPYIYIRKVFDKNKAKEHVYEHPDIWNKSPNTASQRRPRTALPHDERSPERSFSPNVTGMSNESPKKRTTKEERRQAYAENANLRNFVFDFYQHLHTLLLHKQTGQENEEYPLEEYFRNMFKDCVKQKKLTLNAKDEDKFVDLKIFVDFMLFCGFDDKAKPDIEKIFEKFAENKGPVDKPLMKISIKAFQYNFKKFLRDKFRIRYVLSDKACKQRNADLKLYLKDFLSTYEFVRDHLREIKNKESMIRSGVMAYELTQKQQQELKTSLMEHLNRTIDEKYNLVMEKKVLLRFLELRYKKFGGLVDIATIDALLTEIRTQKAEDLTFIGNFIHEFKREKQLFKEDNFNLFEMVNFIHEKKVTKAQFELLQYYIDKLKKLYNLANGLAVEEYLDPRTPLPNPLLSTTFDRICTKAEKQNDILSNFLSSIEQYYQANRGDAVVERVNRIIEWNIVADYILKYVADVDRHLLSQLDKLEEVENHIKDESAETLPVETIRGRIYKTFTGEELPVYKEAEGKKTMDAFAKFLKIDEKDQSKPKTGTGIRFKDTKDDDLDNFIDLLNEKKAGPKEQKLDESYVFADKLKAAKDNKMADSMLLGSIEGADKLAESLGFSGSAEKFNAKMAEALSSPPQNDKRVIDALKPHLLDTIKSAKIEAERQDEIAASTMRSSLLKKNENLSRVIEGSKDPNFITRSTLKEKIDEIPYVPDAVNLGREKPKIGRFGDYEAVLPADYYTFLAKKNIDMDQNKWFLRSHHIETLTENPRSVKDNLMGAEYISYYGPVPENPEITKAQREVVGYSNLEEAIQNLENNRERLKKELEFKMSKRAQVQQQMTSSGAIKEVAKYYDTHQVQKKEGSELLVTAYEGMLDQLRAKERELLNFKREGELQKLRPPPNKWWELKDKTFIDEYVKHVFMTQSDPVNVDEYLKFVEELQNRELT